MGLGADYFLQFLDHEGHRKECGRLPIILFSLKDGRHGVLVANRTHLEE